MHNAQELDATMSYVTFFAEIVLAVHFSDPVVGHSFILDFS